MMRRHIQCCKILKCKLKNKIVEIFNTLVYSSNPSFNMATPTQGFQN